MYKYYTVSKDSTHTLTNVTKGEIIYRKSNDIDKVWNISTDDHVTNHDSVAWVEISPQKLIESESAVVFFARIYKGKDTIVRMAYSDGHSYTIRTDKNGTRVFDVICKANKRNSALTVARNKSKLKRKNYLRKKGYFESREDAIKGEHTITTCTLLRKWKDLKGKLVYPLIGSPKVDGIRCTKYANEGGNSKIKLISRGGIEIIAPHLKANLASTWELDGELYIPGYSLEKIMSIVVKDKHPEKAKLHFFIFDIPVAIPFIERLKILETYKDIVGLDTPNTHVHILPQKVIRNEQEADEFYLWCLDKGYEGTVYRTLDGVYCDGRTKEIIKRKPLISEEFLITDILYDKDDLVYFELECEAGLFKSIPSWMDEERNVDPQYARATWIGRYAEVEYQDVTARGIPKFSNVKIIRKIRVNAKGHKELIY